VDRIKYDEIAADLRGHYEASGKRNLEEADDRVAHLKRFFAGSKVASLGPNDFTQYALTRQKQGAANGTINRDLGVLGRMLRLAYENGKLHRPPIIRQLKEADPRSVFFERDQYGAVRRRLPDDLKGRDERLKARVAHQKRSPDPDADPSGHRRGHDPAGAGADQER
jgi:hypothetical protein